jgi:hypothetical protein
MSILSALLIFFIGVQPPNDWALWITVGFLILTAVVWVAFEQRRFQGPPIGDQIAKRQAKIASAERAISKAWPRGNARPGGQDNRRDGCRSVFAGIATRHADEGRFWKSSDPFQPGRQ